MSQVNLTAVIMITCSFNFSSRFQSAFVYTLRLGKWEYVLLHYYDM